MSNPHTQLAAVTGRQPVDVVAVTTSTTTPTGNMTDNMVESFIDMMTQFLSAMLETFPVCLRVRAYNVGWEARLQAVNNSEEFLVFGKEVIEGYHESMEPFYTRCTAHDSTLLQEDIDLMTNIGMKDKWDAGMHPETEEAMWAFINKLNEFANLYMMYSCIPGGMMTSIETMAHAIAGKITGGQMSLTDLNLGQLSSQVMEAINPNDMQEFVQTVQSGRGIGNVNVMMSMVSNLMQSQQM